MWCRKTEQKVSIRMNATGKTVKGYRATSTVATFRPLVGTALLILASLMTTSVARAGALDKIVLFHIEAASLSEALLQFAAQSDLRISFSCPMPESGLRSSPINGEYAAGEALSKLLQGTGFRYRAKDGTIEILPRTGSCPPTVRTVAGSSQSSLQAGPNGGARSRHRPDPQSDASVGASRSAPEGLTEVIVTAQKYRQSAFDVPISLSVIGSGELQRLNITNLSELQYDVPGLYVEGDNVFNYIVLRGVSNESGNGALVGQYIDDADITNGGFLGQAGFDTSGQQIYDLNRVEVLKGPQGTLYGDGAMGGVIRYITNKPELDEIQMSADVAALFTRDGAPGQRVDAMLNAPLIAGTLGLRIAGQLQHNGGWVDEPAADLKNINGLDVSDVRIEALWQPHPNFKALATEALNHETYGIGAGEDQNGNIVPVYGLTLVPNGQQTSSLSNLTVTADFARAELLSSSTYSRHTEQTHNQSYALPTEVELLAYDPLSNQSFSEEMRLTNVSHGPWQWVLGGFYKDYRDLAGGSEYFGPPGLPFSTALHYYGLGNSEQERSDAAFVDTSYRALSRLTLGVGIRYFQSQYRTTVAGNYLNGRIIIAPTSAKENFNSSDPRFYARYGISSHLNVYATAAKGFRSGEPNVGLLQGFDPESLWSYDLGTKMRYLQDRLHSNLDAFYERYSNYVGSGIVDVNGVPIFGTFNIGSARIRGLDADIALASAEWRAALKGEAVESKFVSISAKQTGFAPNQRLPLVPKYTVVGSIERKFHWGTRPGFAQVSYSQTARVASLQPGYQSDAMHFLSFRTGIRWNRHLRLAFSIQNLLNDRGYLDPNWYESSAYRPRPRTFGVEFASTLE